MLGCFDIVVFITGELPDASTKKTMFVANHVSWADIHALNSVLPLRFVAKTEIKNWPVFGYLVKKSNTIFVERSKRQHAGRLVEVVTKSLAEGDNVGFFPEGTTTDGTHLLSFKSSLLQAIADANASVQPVAIQYLSIDGSINTQMAYAGETTLVESMQNVLRQKTPSVTLHFLTAIEAEGKNRREICQAAHEAIAAKLNYV